MALFTASVQNPLVPFAQSRPRVVTTKRGASIVSPVRSKHRMPDEISIKPTAPGDEEAVQSFVNSVFDEFVGPDISQEGLDSFHSFMSLESMAERRSKGNIQLAATTADGVLAGVAEGRDNSHLTLLFVNKRFHRQGIGTRLLGELLQIMKENDPSVRAITVYATPFALEFYKRVGFTATAPEGELLGIRCTPMELQL